MARIRHLTSALIGLGLATAALGPLGAVHAQSPTTLRFASPDPEGRASEAPIRFFVDEVARRSGGTLTVEAEFAVTDPDGALPFEQYAADRVSKGEYQLALVASRGWDRSGITSPWALQAPFLIDNDALAVAVATSDVADQVMDGMAAAGVTGLALWPEDLRHPFSFASLAQPFLEPADFAGTTIRAVDSHVGWELLRAMGATPVFLDGYGRLVVEGKMQGAESGFLQGATLGFDPTATSNITFFPKYQVLVANTEALGQLSDEQRAILADAAVATRDHAIETRTSEAAAGEQWCSLAQGRVVHASPEGVTAFEAAAAPVYAEIEADPTTKAIVDDIRELKATTPATAPAAECQPPQRQGPPTEIDQTPALPLPGGTYRAVITAEDLMSRGVSATLAPKGAATYFLTVEGTDVVLHLEGDPPENDCTFPTEVVDSVVHMTLAPCWDENSLDLQWRPGEDGALDLTVVGVDPVWLFGDNSAWLSRTWERVE